MSFVFPDYNTVVYNPSSPVCSLADATTYLDTLTASHGLCLSSRPPTVQQEVDRQEAADVLCSLQGTVWWSRVSANVNMQHHRSGKLKNKLHPAL